MTYIRGIFVNSWKTDCIFNSSFPFLGGRFWFRRQNFWQNLSRYVEFNFLLAYDFVYLNAVFLGQIVLILEVLGVLVFKVFVGHRCLLVYNSLSHLDILVVDPNSLSSALVLVQRPRIFKLFRR